MSIVELFQDEGYLYLNGKQNHRECSELLLMGDLRQLAGIITNNLEEIQKLESLLQSIQKSIQSSLGC